MKTINIKGKEYVEVNERLKHFRANYKDHSLADEVKVAIANQNKKTAPQKTTIELEIGGNNWDKVLNYVAVNKEKGLPTIVKELQRKYNVTAKHKTELNKIIKTK